MVSMAMLFVDASSVAPVHATGSPRRKFHRVTSWCSESRSTTEPLRYACVCKPSRTILYHNQRSFDWSAGRSILVLVNSWLPGIQRVTCILFSTDLLMIGLTFELKPSTFVKFSMDTPSKSRVKLDVVNRFGIVTSLSF